MPVCTHPQTVDPLLWVALTWLLSFCALTCTSFCGPQTVSALRSFTFFLLSDVFPHSDVSLSLRPSEGVCPLPVFFSIHCARAHPLAAVSQLYPWPHHFAPAPSLAICHGFQRLAFRSDGFLSLASRFDARGDLDLGKCSAQDPQCSPLLVRADARGSDFPHVCVGVHDRGKLPARPRGSGNTGALVTADHAPPPPSFLMSQARLDSPRAQPKCRRYRPRTPSLSCTTHHRRSAPHRCRRHCRYRHHHRRHCHLPL